MSDKKVFSINPELFSFSNTTKKKRSPSKERIKMKPIKNQIKNDTLRKKSILKMIREHNSDRNRENFSKYEEKLRPATKSNDFEAAKNFFKQMPSSNKDKTNYTIKNYANITDTPIFKNNDVLPLNNIINDNQINVPIDDNVMKLNSVQLPAPKHGCLKNGSLPTYRQYMNQTRKNIENNNGGNVIKPSEGFVKANAYKQMEKLKNLKKKKRRMQKRTIRRTYKTGKSRTIPRISVLLSNKTMRSNVLEREVLLKQVPIDEIKKYLNKQGFTKVGTTTPNDVLRKMYESALLICGEVTNYNADTLTYNFLNSDSS
tara:strand:+ start:759 stop:1703 length:945 start_codon:yes stop_codon:yes gene_type:complete